MNDRVLTLVAAVLVLLMFLISSVYKLRDPDSYTKVLAQKIGGNTSVARLLIYCAALLQLLAPLVIAAHFATSVAGFEPHPWLRTLAVLSCVGLVLFTVIATIMFKVPSFNTAKPWPLLSNVSVTGALALLAVSASA